MTNIIERVTRKAIKPRRPESPWRWAEKHVRLSERTSNSPGRYDSSLTPYVRAWHEAFANPLIREIVVVTGTQVGKSETQTNCIKYAITEDGAPMLLVLPAESIARSFSETRLQPGLRDCGPCAALIPTDPDGFKLLEMNLQSCTLRLIGANSAAQLSSRAIRYLFLDEVDKFPTASAREAGALELAKSRVATYWNSKVFMTSTPTTEAGPIWQNYLLGSRSKFYVPCPHCQHFQELTFPSLRWPNDSVTKPAGVWNVEAVERLAFYECAGCHQAIDQNQRHNMVKHGEWRATNPAAPADKVSFHLNSLYTPWRSWGSVAREFLESKDSPSGLQNFTNSILAEPWRAEVSETIGEVQVIECRADYSLGTVPVKPLFVTLAGDVQRDCVYFTVRAWGEGGESWLLDYGKLPTLESFNEVLAREYAIVGTAETVRITKGLIDSGYNSQAVYELCWKSRGKLHPAKGWETLSGNVKKAMVPIAGGSGRNAFTIALYHFDDNAFKHQLYIVRIQDRQGPKWHLPFNVANDYIDQLTAEKLVEKKNARGVPVQSWHRTRPDNHLGDCEKMQLVQGHLLAPQLRTKPAAPPTPPTPPPMDPASDDAHQVPTDDPIMKIIRVRPMHRTPRLGGFVNRWR